MRRAELSLSHLVAVPLIDELAVLVEVNDPRGADVVGRVVRIGVVGALVRVPLADVDVAVRSEGDHHRLPEQPLSFGFVPIAPAAALAPIVSSSLPSGLIFITVAPFAAVIQTLSSASTAMPCALSW